MIRIQCYRIYFQYSGLIVLPVTLPTMYKTDRVPARFSVVSVQGSKLPEVQPVASVLSLLGRVPVRFQALDRPILDLKLPDPIRRTNRPVRVHLNTETRRDRNPLLLISQSLS